MIVELEVAEFVDDDVIDAVDWDSDEVEIQRDVAGFGATSPAPRHLANADLGH